LWTTTGIVNPVEEIGAVVANAGAAFILDAMSSFGAIPLSLETAHADFVISSANKCVEGVPGFGFILARRDALLAAKGRARTFSLDMHAPWAGLEADGQFRFTPPTHVLLAFHQALEELDAEGRCRRTHGTLSPQLRGPLPRYGGVGLRALPRRRRSRIAWAASAGIAEGSVSLVGEPGRANPGHRPSEKVVWQLIRPYAEAAGVAGIAPQDCRRTCAKLCRAAGGELEQIQMPLGHASVQTTERYLGTRQDLLNAPNDAIKLKVAV
jgi:hypothetical protein